MLVRGWPGGWSRGEGQVRRLVSFGLILVSSMLMKSAGQDEHSMFWLAMRWRSIKAEYAK